MRINLFSLLRMTQKKRKQTVPFLQTPSGSRVQILRPFGAPAISFEFVWAPRRAKTQFEIRAHESRGKVCENGLPFRKNHTFS